MFVGSFSPTIVTKFLSHSQSGRYKHISPTLPLWKSSQLPLRDEKQILPLDILNTVLITCFQIFIFLLLRKTNTIIGGGSPALSTMYMS